MASEGQASSMAKFLDDIIPLGRSGQEYLQMFNLYNIHENRSFIDCGSGPSSFNAFMTQEGKRVVSVDPLYHSDAASIAERVKSSFDKVVEGIRQNKEFYLWERYKTIEELTDARLGAMQCFLDDYTKGREEGRYVASSLPAMPFEQNSFDLALCSHLLFLYSKHLTLQFHVDAIVEMIRVAKEARIFPIVDLEGNVSVHLKDVIKQLKKMDLHTQIISVPYEFQRGANQCLIVRKRSSEV
jgi:hypothetical protein